MNTSTLKILVADDHAILRAGLRRLLQEMPEVAGVGEAGDGAQVIQMVRAERWDVLILDLDMPGQNPLEVLRLVKNDHPEIQVLILSMYPEEQFAVRTLRAGAAGYLSKRSAPEQLVSAVRILSAGGAYISAGVAASLAGSIQTRQIDSLDQLLSDREFTVLRALAIGRTIGDIARELHLSAKTVSTYRTRVLTKLDLHSNVDLARYAAEHGLVK